MKDNLLKNDENQSFDAENVQNIEDVENIDFENVFKDNGQSDFLKSIELYNEKYSEEQLNVKKDDATYEHIENDTHNVFSDFYEKRDGGEFKQNLSLNFNYTKHNCIKDMQLLIRMLTDLENCLSTTDFSINKYLYYLFDSRKVPNNFNFNKLKLNVEDLVLSLIPTTYKVKYRDYLNTLSEKQRIKPSGLVDFDDRIDFLISIKKLDINFFNKEFMDEYIKDKNSRQDLRYVFEQLIKYQKNKDDVKRLTEDRLEEFSKIFEINLTLDNYFYGHSNDNNYDDLLVCLGEYLTLLDRVKKLDDDVDTSYKNQGLKFISPTRLKEAQSKFYDTYKQSVDMNSSWQRRELDTLYESTKKDATVEELITYIRKIINEIIDCGTKDEKDITFNKTIFNDFCKEFEYKLKILSEKIKCYLNDYVEKMNKRPLMINIFKLIHKIFYSLFVIYKTKAVSLKMELLNDKTCTTYEQFIEILNELGKFKIDYCIILEKVITRFKGLQNTYVVFKKLEELDKDLSENLLSSFGINVETNTFKLKNQLNMDMGTCANLFSLCNYTQYEYAFVQKNMTGDKLIEQMWFYSKDKVYVPLEIDEAYKDFNHKLSAVFPSTSLTFDDANVRKFKDMIKTNLLANTANKQGLSPKQKFFDVMTVVCNNGTLYISKKDKGVYVFKENYFNPFDFCFLRVNVDVDLERFETLINKDDENLLKTFLIDRIYEIQNVGDDGYDENKLNFVCACITNVFQTDEHYAFMTQFIGARKTGKTSLIDAIGNAVKCNIETNLDPHHVEEAFSSNISQHVLYGLSSETSVKNYNDNNKLKVLIERGNLTIHQKYAMPETIDPLTKFVNGSENVARIKNDGGLNIRVGIFKFKDRSDTLFGGNDGILKQYKGNVTAVLNSDNHYFLELLYTGVQFQIDNIFSNELVARDNRIYHYWLCKLFPKTYKDVIEYSNPEIEKMLELFEYKKGCMYITDMNNIYNGAVKSGLFNMGSTEIQTGTFKQYLRIIKENKHLEICYENIEFNNNNKATGINKGRPLCLNLCVKKDVMDKLVAHYVGTSQRQLFEKIEKHYKDFNKNECLKIVYDKFNVEFKDVEEYSYDKDDEDDVNNVDARMQDFEEYGYVGG